MKQAPMKKNRRRNERRHARIAHVAHWIHEQSKTLKCERCRESSFIALEFHRGDHRPESSIGDVLYKGKSLKHVKRQLAKHTVLCSNCHRKVEYENRYPGVAV